jgi:hypothetical protein
MDFEKPANDLGRPRKMGAGEYIDVDCPQPFGRSFKKRETGIGPSDIARQNHYSLLQRR